MTENKKKEIRRMIIDGKVYKDIAGRLNVSYSTIAETKSSLLDSLLRAYNKLEKLSKWKAHKKDKEILEILRELEGIQ